MSEPLGAHAIWAREVNERYEQLGLDFLTGYVLGRAAPLGDVPTSVVVTTFGVFEPGLVGGMYEQGRASAGLGDALIARQEGAQASLQRILGDAQVAQVVDVLRRGLDAASGVARPLYRALAAQPWPRAPLGALWRACELLREHRGDSHLAAAVAAGLDAVEMNILTELYCGMPLGSYTATRGWGEEDIAGAVGGLERRGLVAGGELTDAGWREREEIESRTDLAQRHLIEAIGDDFDRTCEQLASWSEAVVAGEGFPADPHKRAAG